MAQLGIFDESFDRLEAAMRAASMRQAVIAHNIANANTPGYVAMDFDAELGRAVERLEKKNVVLEEELSSLTKNSMDYSSYVKILSSKLNVLRTVATQGRR